MQDKQLCKYFIIIYLLFSFLPSYGQNDEYGILLSEFLAVRGETSDSSERVTQLLFGDAFKIIKKSEDKSWVYIKNSYDNYEGWIQAKLATPITKEYFKEYTNARHPVCVDKNGIAAINKNKIAVPLGSTLPFYDQKGYIRVNQEKYKFSGKSRSMALKTGKAGIIRTAKTYLGAPYLWGGKSQKGLDCSGFTQTVFKTHGIKILRDSYQQAEQGKLIKFSEAKPGDLLFFQKTPGKDVRVSHVGIYLGNNQLIHAFDKVEVDQVDEKGIHRNGEYLRFLKFVRRY